MARTTVEIYDDADFPAAQSDAMEQLVRRACNKVVRSMLLDMLAEAQITLNENDAGQCVVQVWINTDIGTMTAPFSQVIDDWLQSRARKHGIHPDDARPLTRALEVALAAVKTATADRR